MRAAPGAILSLLLIPTLADVTQLGPGNPLLRPDRIRQGTDTSYIAIQRDGQERPGPMQVEAIRRTARKGQEVFEHVIVVDGGRFRMDDTTWYDSRTLAPLAHRSHGPGRTFSLDYAPGRVTGSMTDSAGAHPIDVALPSTAFDPSSMHAVFRSLELAPGQRYAIPMFNHEKRAIVTDTLAVEGEDIVDTDQGKVAAWRLTMATPDRRATYYVSRADGRDLKVIVTWAGGELRVRHSGVK